MAELIDVLTTVAVGKGVVKVAVVDVVLVVVVVVVIAVVGEVVIFGFLVKLSDVISKALVKI